MTERSNYTLLLQKLDAFTRRYYLNQMLRGGLFTAGALVAAYLLVSWLEFTFFFSSPIRRILFFSFVGGGALLTGRWLVLPAIHYFKLGRVISHRQAAAIIGSHFGEVKDRLLNVLELRAQAGSAADRSLIEASIEQKIEAMKPVPFSRAIDLRRNRRYLPFALPPVVALVFILFAAPNMLRESNVRLIRNGKVFERDAPFRFLVGDSALEVLQYGDFELEVILEGSALPESVEIVLEGNPYRMRKLTAARYAYQFNKVQQDLDFYLEAGGFRSTGYRLTVLPKPVLQRFSLALDFPGYTGLADRTQENLGDAEVPQGTRVLWTFQTSSAERVGLRFGDSTWQAERNGADRFVLERVLMDDAAYRVGMSNDRVVDADSASFVIRVQPDEWPSISIERFEDSTNNKFLYFLGDIGDDYGVRNLLFRYQVDRPDRSGEMVKLKSEDLPVEILRGQRHAAFSWSFDLAMEDLEPGDRVTYYFEVWDNDGVNGSKSTRSAAMVFEMPTMAEFEALDRERREDVKQDLEEALQEIDEVQEEIKRLREKLVQKKELDWADKQQIKDLVEQRESIQENIEQIREQFSKSMQEQSEFKEPSERLLEKQQKLQELFDQVLDDEMRKMFEELEQLLEELSKEQSLEELEDMELSDEQLEEELDRMLELFKQMEFQQQMEDVANKLEELAEEQLELSEESQQKDADASELEERQEAIEEQFEELREEMDRLEEMNEALEQSHEMEDTETQEEEIGEHMEQSQQMLQQQKMNKASEQQQQSGEKMQQMASQMMQQLTQMQQQQAGEDLQALRQLLDNLIKLSFDQEDLMDELRHTPVNNPRYVELAQEQFKIREDAEMVEDSLRALAKRVFEISTYVMRELGDMNYYMDLSLDELAERRVNQAVSNQQYVMTAMNNLALMLDEVMQQMQQQMASQMQGNQMCNKPGSNPKPGEGQKPSMGDLQKQLNDQLKQLKDGQKGRNPLGSKDFAQMAARQAAIRDALRKLAGEYTGDAQDGDLGKEMREIAEEMERTEEQLVNKVLNEETLERQEEILTRLLEAEDAERQREIDPQRKSDTAQEVAREMPPSLEEYLRKRQAEVDLYKTVSPDLKPYYKNLVDAYIRVLGSEQ